MGFAVAFQGGVYEAGPPLLDAVLASVRRGLSAADEVFTLVMGDQIDVDAAVGLAAALLGGSDPAGVAEGARLASRLGDPRLVAFVERVVEQQDLAILLAPDPLAPLVGMGASVEDALLRTWAELAPLLEDRRRAELLERLRHAGLRDLELGVLARVGSEEEVDLWLPTILSEGVPPDAASAFRVGLQRAQPVADSFRAVWDALPLVVRRQIALDRPTED